MRHDPSNSQAPLALVVLDFEATCDDGPAPPRPQEVIELPSVLLDGPGLEVVDTFESFVRPIHHPRLTDFCTGLTTITQADVDGAPPFREVLDAHLAWLRGHGLALRGGDGGRPWAFVTCGDWDLATLFPAQALACDPPLGTIPWPYRRWINVKRAFARHAGVRRAPGMPAMLEALGLPLVGTHHRGIDDCHNIARLTRALAAAGQPMTWTAALDAARYPPVPLVLVAADTSREVTLEKRTTKTLFGAAHRAFRRRMRAARTAAGRPIREDADLFDLEPGDSLVVS